MKAKRILSLLLTMAMVLGLIPTGIFPVFNTFALDEDPLTSVETKVTEIEELAEISVRYLRSDGTSFLVDKNFYPNLLNGGIALVIELDKAYGFEVRTECRILQGSVKTAKLAGFMDSTKEINEVVFAPGETEKRVEIVIDSTSSDYFNSAEDRWQGARSFVVQFYNPVNAKFINSDNPNDAKCAAANGLSANIPCSMFMQYSSNTNEEDVYISSKGYFYDYDAGDSLADPMAKYRIIFDMYGNFYTEQSISEIGTHLYRRRDFGLRDPGEQTDNRNPGFGQESYAFQYALEDSNASGASVGMEIYETDYLSKPVPIITGKGIDYFFGGKITVLGGGDVEYYSQADYTGWPAKYRDNALTTWLGGYANPFPLVVKGSWDNGLAGSKRAVCHLPKDQYNAFINTPLKRFLLYDLHILDAPDGFPPYVNLGGIVFTAGQFSVELIDFIPPVVKSITAPQGTAFYPGQVVPVTLEFSEPVTVHHDATIRINGVDSPFAAKNIEYWLNRGATTSKRLDFLYTVQELDNAQTLEITIPDPSKFTDLVGNALALTPADASVYWDTAGYDFANPYTINGMNLITPLESAAITGFAAGKAAYNFSDTVTVTLSDSADPRISQWLRESVDGNDVLGKAYLAVRNPQTDEIDTYSFRVATDGSGINSVTTYTAQFPASRYAPYASKMQLALFYGSGVVCDSDGVFSGGEILYSKLLYINLGEPKFAASVILDEAAYPSGGKLYFSGANTVLAASVSPADSDFPEILWSSSMDNVAEIDPNTGEVWVQSAGKVSFTATATNGGLDGKAVSATTPEFEVVDDGTAVLSIPQNANRFNTRKGDDVTLRMVTNLNFENTDFTMKLYDAADLTTPVYMYNGKLVEPKLTVDGQYMQKLSPKGANLSLEPAYVFEISAPNPSNPGSILSAKGYIVVYPQPPLIKFDSLGDTYVTDYSGSFELKWTMENLIPDTDDFALSIYKNGDPAPVYSTDSFVGGVNAYTLTVPKVESGQLKDIYSIQAVASNQTGMDADAMLLYVYNHDALDILVRNANGNDATPAGGNLTLSNRSMIAILYNSGGSEAVLGLKRDINLQRLISINYGGYAWSGISDQIEWLSDNIAAATINYRQGTVYEPLSSFTYTKYPPGTDFSLAGTGDGSAKITATHARSGQAAELNVDVETLKDQLYIFQFYPRQATKVSYANGAGAVVDLTSDDEGLLAVYEPSGIAGDVSVQSGSGDMVYLGTVYNERLKSGEYDSANRGLYPVNIFQLRNTKIEVYFKNPDGGSPWSGEVLYSGSVYKNGKLCEASLIHRDENKTLNVDDMGHFLLNLDASKFWVSSSGEELSMKDELTFEFILECGPGLIYYPVYINTDGTMNTMDIVKVGANIVNLHDNAKNGEANPFVAAQKIKSPYLPGARDVIEYDRNIGPSDYVPEQTLISTVLWWGEDPYAEYGMQFETDKQAKLQAQTILTRKLPFFDAAVTVNEALLTDETVGNGTAFNLAAGESCPVMLRILDPDGSFRFSYNCAFSMGNGVGLRAIEDSENLEKQLKYLQEMLDQEILKANEVPGEVAMLEDALKKIQYGTIPGQLIGLAITYETTVDPYVFNAYLRFGGSNYGDHQGVNEFSLGVVAMQLTFYLRAEVRIDKVTKDWGLKVVEGGFSVNFELKFPFYIPLTPLPIGLSINPLVNVGFAMQFQDVHKTTPAGEHVYAMGDHLMTFMVTVGIEAMLGFGSTANPDADFGIFVGVYGKVSLDTYRVLLNEYSPEKSIYDSYQATVSKFTGEIGAKVEVALLVFNWTYSYKIASFTKDVAEFGKYGNVKAIQDWLKKYGMKDAYGIFTETQTATRSGDYFVEESKTGISVENRDYLNRGERAWASASRMRAAPGTIADIMTNAYPGSLPMVSGDGEFFVYCSDGSSVDINDKNISWALKNASGGYDDKGAIDNSAAALPLASRFDVAGNGNFAVAAWEAQRERAVFANPDAPTDSEIDAVLGNSEIAAAIYDGNSWAAVRLTDNAQTDMSPVAAAGNGSAFVAWKNMAGSGTVDGELSINDVSNRVCYSIYKNGAWSDAGILLGNASGIKSMNAAMLSDGTSMITYIRDDDVYSMLIDINGNIISTSCLTTGGNFNQNPQVQPVLMPSGEEVFIVGWHQSDSEETGNVMLAAVKKNGAVIEEFTNSVLSALAGQGIVIGYNYRFAPNQAGNIDGLSLIWNNLLPPENETEAASAELYGVKICYDNAGKMYFTAVQRIAETNAEEQFLSFDGWYDSSSGTLNTVMLLKDWSDSDRGSRIAGASASYQNSIEANAYVNHSEIVHDFQTAFPFCITNTGSETIDSVKIALQGGTEESYGNLQLLPNQTKMLYVEYLVPAAQNGIKDISYSVEAAFTSGDKQYASGILGIAIPNAGITAIETVSAGGGLRTFIVSMQNLSDVEFSGNTAGYTAHLGVYTDPDYQTLAMDSGGNDMLYQLSALELELLDASALTKLITYKLPDDGFENGDVSLYAKAWAEAQGNKITQYYQNSARRLLFADPVMENGGNPVKITVALDNSSGVTEAAVTAENLSFTPASNGNLIVALLGPGGEVLETLLYASDASSLINLGKEESKTFKFTFSQPGHSVQAEYYTVDPSSMNADLASIRLSAIAVDFDTDTLDYDLSAMNIGETVMTAAAANPAATVTVKDGAGNTLASGRGAVSYAMPLPVGASTIVQVVVQPENSVAQPKAYSFNITNTINGAGGIVINASDGTVTVTDTNSIGFVPAKWQYCLDGTWSAEYIWTSTQSFQASSTEYMSVYVRVFDAEGRYMDSNTLSGIGEGPLSGKLRLGVFGEETGYINQDVEFTIAARNATDILTVNVTFEMDGSLLAFKGIEGLNGFDMVNGVSWRSMGGDVWRGTVTLGYPDTGTETGTGFTNASYTDIGKLTFAPRAAGDVSVTLVKIDRVTGKAGLDVVDVDAVIENGVATTNIELVYSKYDLNRDGVVDALDLGMVLLYCGWDSDSPDWDTEIKVYDSHGKGVTAKMCDVNLDGVIDMLDLLDLFIHYTK